MIGRDAILKLVPHAGSMCLIERASSWDPKQIHCEAISHRDPQNPLRRLGALSAVHIIEYGAQAAALHASLLATDAVHANKAGMLVSVRDCELRVERLDDLLHALQIRASREAGSAEALTYSFEASHQDSKLGRGRLMIKLAPVGPRINSAR
jgi:predicted hotdog family 3-hydroxylacyl-ACP dehydratase